MSENSESVVNPESLYKFRSFQNFEFIMDILVNERLHCSPYEDLNDPFEGTFVSVTKKASMNLVGGGPRFGPPKTTKEYRRVSEITKDEKQIARVCSLSKDYHDVRMWAHYGDGNKGLAIKIHFGEHNKNLHEVKYSKTLPSVLSKEEKNMDAVNVLTKKTDHWTYETEYRIITADDYYNINGRIKEILLGTRVRSRHANLLIKMIKDKYPIYSTKLDKDEIKIKKDQPLNSNP